jgi:hypothetical protein
VWPTKVGVTELWDLINNDRARKLQETNWRIDPVFINFERERLAENIVLEAGKSFVYMMKVLRVFYP